MHDLNTDFAGFQRDSNGLTGKVGTTLNLTRRLSGKVGVGYTRREYEDPRFETSPA